MKKKNQKNKTEEAFKVVEAFKTNAEILQKTEQDKEFAKTLGVAVRKMDKLEKEIVALKEKLKNKKSVFEQERELTLEYVKTAKKILNKELDKKLNPLKKQKKQKPPKTEKVEEPK
ncbi:MAG: hypothetical protein WCL70_12190 [Paludibacter sp.]